EGPPRIGHRRRFADAERFPRGRRLQRRPDRPDPRRQLAAVPEAPPAGDYARHVSTQTETGSAEQAERPILCLSTSPTMQRTLVFDRVIPGDTNRADEVHDYASGKAVNAARVLHTLGYPTRFI